LDIVTRENTFDAVELSGPPILFTIGPFDELNPVASGEA